MRLFWDPVVKPLLEAVAARRVVEIGAGKGEHSIRLARWCRRHGARLEIVDPAPKPEVVGLAAAFPGHARVHAARSLDVLGDLLPADVVLIDGDHNWYTVYHELLMLYGHTGPVPAEAPIAICHDTAWPYGHRDRYQDPDAIPPDFQQPMARGGLHVHTPGVTVGGFNRRCQHAMSSGGPRNGVRAGIMDALGVHSGQFRVVWLDVGFGLAIIVPVNRIAAHSGLGGLLDRLEPSANWKLLAALLEQQRIADVIALEAFQNLLAATPASPARERSFASSLPGEVVAGINRGMADYRYKGRRMQLHPFDMANYLAVLGKLRPGTIFEIGTLDGGRALWLADMTRVLAADAQIIAVDLRPPGDLDVPRIRFLTGDARNLALLLDDSLLAALPRPFLVIEDAAHDEETCRAVLEFFDRHLRRGDMIVIEDGHVGLLVATTAEASAPSAAIARFLSQRGEDYDIDTDTCDRYGYNATANPNGWLRRR